MIKRAKIVLTIISSIVTTVLLAITVYRSTWNYNENGVYLDEQTMTTYDEDAIISYASLTILLLVPTVMLMVSLKNPK